MTTWSDEVISSLTVVENVPLSYGQRATLVDLLRQELRSVALGEIYYPDRDNKIAELQDLIDVLNTPN